MKAFVTELIGDESIPLSEIQALATNMGADGCNWHPRDKFESCYWFRLIDKICISDEQEHQLWALFDDGGRERACVAPRGSLAERGRCKVSEPRDTILHAL